MSDLWTVVSDVDRGETNAKPPSQLNVVQTKAAISQTKSRTLDSSHIPASSTATRIHLSAVKRAEDALQLLRSEPDTDSLLFTLKRISSPKAFEVDFDIHSPGPLAAQIINTIVSSIIPTFWSALGREDRALIAACLLNVAGLNSVIARIQLLISRIKNSKSQDNSQALRDLFATATDLFRGDDNVVLLWQGLSRSTSDSIKRRLTWKECSNLLGSGKVVNVLAEAEDLLRSAGETVGKPSITSANEYASWLGFNIAQSVGPARNEHPKDLISDIAVLFARTLSLGYPIPLMQALHGKLLQDSTPGTKEPLKGLISVLGDMQAFTKRRYVDHVLRWLSCIEPPLSEHTHTQTGPSCEACAIAALLQVILKDDIILQQQVVSTLSDPALLSTISLLTIRASITTLASICPDEMDSLIERQLKLFGDQIFVRHSPVLQQESLAQALLVTAGFIHRRSPMALLMTARSSGHMQGVSNRLDASNPRARWLGMVVGTALSSLVDKEGSKLNFGTDDMASPEAKQYIELIKVDDKPSTLAELSKIVASPDKRQRSKKQHAAAPRSMPKIDGKPTFGPIKPPEKKQTEIQGDRVAELSDSERDSDDDLTPYAKPDSDAEDSDEDATLVNRDKPRAPVYIRDLMAMLRDTEKHDRFQVGIKHAAPLIRRKANFGREVTDHAEELARILSGLQDPFDTDNFDELRLQALIAVILSDASAIAPWLARQAFAGEFSIAQRCVMLTALGLSGRELAGLKEQDGLNPDIPNTSFPSKKLPPHLDALYKQSSTKTTSNNRLEVAHASLEHSLLQPIALEAADKSTAHLNAVKVRNFSSRMAVERTKRKPAPNELAKIFPEAYFYPLLNRHQQEIATYGSGSIWSTTPFLLVTLVKTLALLFHAAGPATLILSQLSSDFWDLLLSLRVQAVGHVTVLEALLFGLLTVMEVNEDKQMIAQAHSKQLLETQQWADMVFDRTGEGKLVQQDGQGEEAKVRTLAAAVLVKCGEVMEAQRKVLMGDMMGM